jgi:hypothetical protein
LLFANTKSIFISTEIGVVETTKTVVAPQATKERTRQILMDQQVTAALVSGAIGLLGAVLGVTAGGLVTYKIEQAKMAEDMIGKPSQYLHEKRIAMCEEMMIAVDKASAQTWEVWDITDVPDDRKKADQRAQELMASNDMSAELDRLLSLCKIYGGESLVKSFSGYVQLYANVLHNPDHSAATCAMGHSETMANEIRRQLGIDSLSEHLMRYLQKGQSTRSETNSIAEELERL